MSSQPQRRTRQSSTMDQSTPLTAASPTSLASTMNTNVTSEGASNQSTTTTTNSSNNGPAKEHDKSCNRQNSHMSRSSSCTALSSLPSNTDNNNNTNNTNERPSAFVVQVTAIAGLGGILFGYDLGVISSALPQMTLEFQLNSSQQETAVSILYLGGFVGAALGGSLCDAFGRKRAILLTDIVFAVGAFVLWSAPSFLGVVMGRVIVGFAVAVSGIADVSYLHEIAPAQWRGAIVSVNEACISLGFLLAFVVGSIFSTGNNHDGWRAMFGISGFVALIQFIGMWPMPESPTWLRQQGRLEESEAALQRIESDFSFCGSASGSPRRSVSCVELNALEVEKIGTTTKSTPRSYETLSREESSSSTSTNANNITTSPGISSSNHYGGLFGRCISWNRQILYLLQQLRLFAREVVYHYRKQAWIAIFLAVTQQFCGQTNVLSYAPLIFAGVSNKNNNADGGEEDAAMSYVRGWSTLSIGLVKFVVTVLVIWKIESIGRRVLLLWGMATIALGLFLLMIAFSGPAVAAAAAAAVLSSEDNNDNNAANNDATNNIDWGYLLAMPGVLLVVCGYSMSFGPLTWLLTSELFPTEIRGRALGASTIVTYLCAAVVTYTFLSAQSWVGPSAVFGTYWIISCLGLVFAYLAVPDTKEKSEQEIEDDLKTMYWWNPKKAVQSLHTPSTLQETLPISNVKEPFIT